MGNRQDSLVSAAVLVALSMTGCVPDDDHAARPEPSPTVYAASHGGYYVYGSGGHVYTGKTPAKAVQAEEAVDGVPSHGIAGDADADGEHGGFGHSGAGGDAGG